MQIMFPFKIIKLIFATDFDLLSRQLGVDQKERDHILTWDMDELRDISIYNDSFIFLSWKGLNLRVNS